MSEPRREPGYYWIRWTERDKWEPARWTGRHWCFIGIDSPSTADPREIGQRIEGGKGRKGR